MSQDPADDFLILNASDDFQLSMGLFVRQLGLEPERLDEVNATPFLDAFGHVVIAWLWLWQAVIAQRALENEPSDDADFYQGKLAACTFFYRYHLPQAREKLSYVGSMDRTALDAKAT